MIFVAFSEYTNFTATNGAKEARRQLNASRSNGKQDPEREEDLELELDPEEEETTLNSVG